MSLQTDIQAIYDTQVGLTSEQRSTLWAQAITDPRKNFNLLCNPRLDFWHRGTSYTAAGYCADRFRIAVGTASFTLSRYSLAAGELPFGAIYAILLNITSITDYIVISQLVEDVRTLAGENACFGFYCKGSITGSGIYTDYYQNFGAGGSAGIAGDNTPFDVPTSWENVYDIKPIPDISGKTIGTDSNIEFRIVFPPGISGQIYFALFDLYQADHNKEFGYYDKALELLRCQRYSYFPKTNYFFENVAYDTNNVFISFPAPAEMRRIPTLVSGTEGVGWAIRNKNAYAAQSGFTPSMSTSSLMMPCVQFSKAGHGLTDCYANIYTDNGFYFDAEL